MGAEKEGLKRLEQVLKKPKNKVVVAPLLAR